MNTSLSVAVIGGGASGLMAAIKAAKNGALVTLYERNDKVGKKILMTGNGRCNLSNRNMDISCYHNTDSSLLKQILKVYPTERILDLFHSMGLMTKERNGYLYPNNDQASSVLDALRFEACHCGVTIKVSSAVRQIKVTKSNCFEVLVSEEKVLFDRIILCCGGMAAPRTGSDGNGYRLAKNLGHHVTPLYPSLTSLKAKGTFWKEISGVRCIGTVAFYDKNHQWVEENGELQITDSGISGIPVFQISGKVAELLASKKEVPVRISFLSSKQQIECEEMIKERYYDYRDMTICDFLSGTIHKKLVAVIIKQYGYSVHKLLSDINQNDLLSVVDSFSHFNITVYGTNSFDYAQVTKGGILLSEVTDKLESRIVPGLFFAGEILDIDGICGGYNLHFAFASGHYAGGNSTCSSFSN